MLNGCAIADKTQVVDNNTLIDHKVPYCDSKELYKYVLDGKATGAFAGRVLVRHGAQKTTSEERNQNICATRESRMFTQPMLEIYADDVVEEQRSLSPDLLLFDSGDFSQGSTYYTLFKGDVEVGLMNIMRYDAATLGNHEFDFGLDNLARLARLATFPIVCTNCDFSGTPAEGLIKPYAIVRRHGMKIGVIGLCPKIDGLIMRENHEGVTYLDPIESARTTAKMLKQKEKCDLVVCLSHLGWKLAPDMDDNQLIPSITDIDIVLGGHSHTYFKQLEYVNDADGKPVAVNQNGKHGAFVGRLEIELKAK